MKRNKAKHNKLSFAIERNDAAGRTVLSAFL